MHILMGTHTVQEFEQLQSARRKSASAADARVHRKLSSSQAQASDAMAGSEPESSGMPSEEEEEEGEGDFDTSENEEGEDKEDPRHQAMLAEVRGSAGSGRKRKRTAIATEAYPDSEYNLPPTSGPAGAQAPVSLPRS